MKSMIVTTVLMAAVALAGLSVWLWTPDLPRAKLEAVYRHAPNDMIDMGGYRLHVRDTGSRTAPAILMLHGFGSSLHTFEPWARALEGDYRIVRFDLPGSGLSEPDPSGVYTDDRSMEIMLDLMNRLDIGQAILIGNSIGGRLAWRFAAAHSDRVHKLVLISPDGFASPGFEYGRKPDVPAVMTLMRFVLPRMLLRQSVVAAYGDPGALTEQTLDRYYDLMLATGNRAAMIDRMRQTVLVDPEPLLRNIKIPVLLLWGAKDAMIPIKNAADYLRVLPEGKLVTLPSLGHVPHEESPETSLMSIRQFLAERTSDIENVNRSSH